MKAKRNKLLTLLFAAAVLAFTTMSFLPITGASPYVHMEYDPK